MIGFSYEKTLNQITTDMSKLAYLADGECKKALQECGKIYKKNVLAASGGSKRFYGIGAGARASVKKGKTSKDFFLVVKGAKGKAPLWHLANNGFVHNKSHKKIPGNHFVDKAEQMSQSDVDGIIDSAIRNLLD